jgi:hypothetical protein
MNAAAWWNVISSIAASVAALGSLYVVLYVRAAMIELKDDLKDWSATKFPDKEFCRDRHREIERRLQELEREA